MVSMVSDWHHDFLSFSWLSAMLKVYSTITVETEAPSTYLAKLERIWNVWLLYFHQFRMSNLRHQHCYRIGIRCSNIFKSTSGLNNRCYHHIDGNLGKCKTKLFWLIFLNCAFEPDLSIVLIACSNPVQTWWFMNHRFRLFHLSNLVQGAVQNCLFELVCGSWIAKPV